METRQIVGLTGALLLFIGVFTPIVSIPTVGYINYFEEENIAGTVILTLAVTSFLLLLAKQYRALWATSVTALSVLLFTFIRLHARISDIKDKLSVEFTGSHSTGLADWALRCCRADRR